MFAARNRWSTLLAALLLLCVGATSAAAMTSQQYHVYEIAARASTLPAGTNPFTDVAFNITATPPAGSDRAPLQVQGFFDGDDTWRARFACDVLGLWTWTAQSQDSGLAAAHGNVTCVANTVDNIHGTLGHDAAHPHHFMYADGTRYFMMGYECDWLFALGLEPDSTPIGLEPFLDTLRWGGYNHILMQVYANHSNWDVSVIPRPTRVGPTTITPWEEGSHQLRLNLTFWRHLDTVMEALQRRGIVAHLMITVWNKNVNWPDHQSPADDLYWRTVIARYQVGWMPHCRPRGPRAQLALTPAPHPLHHAVVRFCGFFAPAIPGV